ncbi:glycoside hydrolase family 16 protein [Epithele typhae]|uniref:glycoside hydrolase family 16 protein n=1 Tax=Epithele typhae TaxID=378194 RepID=UPI002008E39F|nr:glycoside hydrolase family 16 protein [Epithele typhae]KAH9944400.1 glycoside hydrolase family 16 protein [Epithele typhae]
MLSVPPATLLPLLSATVSSAPWLSTGLFGLLLLRHAGSAEAVKLDTRASSLQTTSNGSTFVWTIQDTYEGDNFFDGMVNYTDHDTAIRNGLAFVTDDGKVVMKGDNTTQLDSGVFRNSVRLFVLDLNHAPWGCGVWPAWWTLGGGQWPYTGEIDILEGVHDNAHNQVTWHTGPNCTMNPNVTFTGTIVDGSNGSANLNCDGTINNNAGCGVTEWSRASYGPIFDAQGGGVFAMKWDDDGIAVWSFYRAAVPANVLNGQPDPSSWGSPVAMLDPSGCDPISNFVNHSIIFGDWAGNSYASSGCPGTCTDRLMDPANFVNASWSINTLKVYRKQKLSGLVNGSAHNLPLPSRLSVVSLVAILPMLALLAL